MMIEACPQGVGRLVHRAVEFLLAHRSALRSHFATRQSRIAAPAAMSGAMFCEVSPPVRFHRFFVLNGFGELWRWEHVIHSKPCCHRHLGRGDLLSFNRFPQCDFTMYRDRAGHRKL
jgi:hypothetical protein